MILLFDIGNTHTHVGLANNRRVLRQINVPTREWFGGKAAARVKKFAGAKIIDGAILCSVVPRATPLVRKTVRKHWKLDTLELTPKTVRGVGIDYPKPNSIGPDRLANAVAARKRFGAPVVVVDFGTAVTFDVVNRAGNYAGGIIAPGLAAMLLNIKGIGPEFAAGLWLEGLFRHFDNRHQVASYAGLAPTPWQSGSVSHEQGVSKAGNPRLRTTLIELAWLWLRNQPTSALSLWFKARVEGGRGKKTTIVAMARKLLVALWKYVTLGVVVEGAVMKNA